MAQILQAFGVKTTLLVRDVMLREVDREVIELLTDNMKKLGLNLLVKSPFKRVFQNAENG